MIEELVEESVLGAEEMLDLSVHLGKVLYHSGASSKRTHDCVEWFLTKMGLRSHCVSIAYSSIAVSVRMANGKWQEQSAPLEAGVNLDLLVRATNLIRDINPRTALASDLHKALDDMSAQPTYPIYVTAFQVSYYPSSCDYRVYFFLEDT